MKASSSLGGKREILLLDLSFLGWGERVKASSLIYEHSFEIPLFNSLTTVGYLLEVFIKLCIPSMVRTFTSAWS